MNVQMVCRKSIQVYYSQGLTQDEKPFVTPMVYPCKYCMETERFKGMQNLLSSLIERRDE